jgi:hypothetical protein
MLATGLAPRRAVRQTQSGIIGMSRRKGQAVRSDKANRRKSMPERMETSGHANAVPRASFGSRRGWCGEKAGFPGVGSYPETRIASTLKIDRLGTGVRIGSPPPRLFLRRVRCVCEAISHDISSLRPRQRPDGGPRRRFVPQTRQTVQSALAMLLVLSSRFRERGQRWTPSAPVT